MQLLFSAFIFIETSEKILKKKNSSLNTSNEKERAALGEADSAVDRAIRALSIKSECLHVNST